MHIFKEVNHVVDVLVVCGTVIVTLPRYMQTIPVKNTGTA
jgi:hypothetical protein